MNPAVSHLDLPSFVAHRPMLGCLPLQPTASASPHSHPECHKKMLAPRKKLWSTPVPVIDAASRFLGLTIEDVLYDVGCGDGRVLVHLASTTPCRRFVGIEIDRDRAREAERAVVVARERGDIPPSASVEVRCQNALEADYSDATAAFLYLVPRGLRLIKPVLLAGGGGRPDRVGGSGSPSLRVVTYMAGFSDEECVARERCEVGHQEGAEWPVYLYHLGGSDR